MNTPLNTDYTAPDGTRLRRYHWPARIPAKGVMHIVHGLAEHAARYEGIGETLSRAGWHVFAADQRGHGQSALREADLGWFGAEHGWRMIVDDLRGLIAGEKSAHPDLPLVVLGHSMGSLVVRNFLTGDAEGVAGAILSGTFGEADMLLRIGRLLARFERLRLGGRGRSGLLHRLSFADFNKAFAPARTEYDWLSRDEAVVDAYAADPLCGFPCTTQLWIDLTDGTGETLGRESRARMRPDLPLYLFCGSRDPVGGNGRVPRALAESYRQAGMQNVTLRIYDGARHECLNEINRDEVMADLMAWLGGLAAQS